MRLSSGMTFLWKFVLPAVWAFAIILGAVEVFRDGVFPPRAIGAFAFFGGALFFTYWLVGSIKSVRLEGDRLIVSNYLRKQEISLQQVALVNEPDFTSGRRIEISLSTPSIFGNDIIFVPRFLAAKSIADMLQRRVEATQRGKRPMPMPEAL